MTSSTAVPSTKAPSLHCCVKLYGFLPLVEGGWLNGTATQGKAENRGADNRACLLSPPLSGITNYYWTSLYCRFHSAWRKCHSNVYCGKADGTWKGKTTSLKRNYSWAEERIVKAQRTVLYWFVRASRRPLVCLFSCCSVELWTDQATYF